VRLSGSHAHARALAVAAQGGDARVTSLTVHRLG
jgi:hypothetical protein